MKKNSIFHTIAVMLPIAWHASPIRFLCINLFGIVQSVLLGINTVLLANFLNHLIAAVGQKSMDHSLLWSILLYAACIILYQLINSLFNYHLTVYHNICDTQFREVYNDKISRLFPIEFEDTEKLNVIQKAEAGRNAAHFFIFHLIGIVDMVPPYVVFLAFYMSSIDPVLLCIILGAFLPAFFMLHVNQNIYTRLEDISAPVRRKVNAYKQCLIGRDFLKETRVLGAYSYFIKKLLDAVRHLCSVRLQADRKTNRIDAVVGIVSLIGYLTALIALVYCVVDETVSVSVFSAIYSSLAQFYGMVTAMVCGFMGETMRNLPAVGNYVSFITEKKPLLSKGQFAESEGIKLENVSFSYPNADTPVIKNVDLHIPAGQHVAIVGENGAGKTTLSKLLIGIYPPSAGSVSIGGLVTGKQTPEAYQEHISAVFQNYVHYQMSLSDNVRISRLTSDQDPIGVLADTNLDDELLKQREQILLSREFGGIDLSSGQWQQIAIARAQYRSHTCILLDEPDGAIDAEEESRIYRRFLEMSKDKTTVLVSHRLGSARLADRIIVLHDGEIAEDGTHEALLKKNGLYRKMWDAQAGLYAGLPI